MLEKDGKIFKVITYRDLIESMQRLDLSWQRCELSTQQLDLIWKRRELSMLLWARYCATILSEQAFE